MRKEKFLGIEIGGTKLQIVCGLADGTVLWAHRACVNREEGAAGIRNHIEAVLEKFRDETFVAAGVGFGGPVNRLTGRVETSFHIDGWSGFSIKAWLEAILKVPVFVDNDANVAALGEATFGAGRAYKTVMYITLGSGVGGGIVIGRQIYHGAVPGEFEIGHLRMDRQGTTLQQLCSGWAVDEKVKAAVAAHPGSTLARLVNGSQANQAIFLKEAIRANDETARQIFEQTTDDLAFGLSHAIHILHPDVLVLGGGLSFMGELLQQSLEKKIQRHLMKPFLPGPPVRLTQLKENAVPVGCLVLCSQKMQNIQVP